MPLLGKTVLIVWKWYRETSMNSELTKYEFLSSGRQIEQFEGPLLEGKVASEAFLVTGTTVYEHYR